MHTYRTVGAYEKYKSSGAVFVLRIDALRSAWCDIKGRTDGDDGAFALCATSNIARPAFNAPQYKAFVARIINMFSIL
jgi:hypothetical protein